MSMCRWVFLSSGSSHLPGLVEGLKIHIIAASTAPCSSHWSTKVRMIKNSWEASSILGHPIIYGYPSGYPIIKSTILRL